MFSRLSYFDKRALVRRILYGGLILLLALLQNSCGLDGIFGVRVFWLLPAAVCIAMFEREISGMFFALFAGALWDLASPYYGMNAIFFTLVGFICGSLIANLMRSNLSTALLLSGVATLLYTLLYWSIAYGIGGVNALRALLTFYLPSFLLTTAVTPLVYWGIRAIAKRFRTIKR